MPGLRFQLASPTLNWRSHVGSKGWCLHLDAKIERPEGYRDFKVLIHGDSYDGYAMDGGVVVSEAAPTVAPEQFQDSDSAAGLSSKEDIDGASRPDRIDVCWWNLEGADREPPTFEISLSLAPDVFARLLQAAMKSQPIAVHLSTPLWGFQEEEKEGLVYGGDPGGRQIEWHVDRKSFSDVDDVTVWITPRADTGLESPTAVPHDSGDHKPSPINSPLLVNAVNRLFWAVVIIGVALLIAAYF